MSRYEATGWAVYVLKPWGWCRTSVVFDSVTAAVDHLAQMGPDNGKVRPTDAQS
jgi:hypothetical protein